MRGTFSVAIGAGSNTSENFVVSVGSTANRRRAVDMGDGALGADSFEAVNGRQLFDTKNRVVALEAGRAMLWGGWERSGDGPRDGQHGFGEHSDRARFRTNVGAAFEAINTTGTRHFRTDRGLVKLYL